jgi:hypothetical protein
MERVQEMDDAPGLVVCILNGLSTLGTRPECTGVLQQVRKIETVINHLALASKEGPSDDAHSPS